MGTNADHTSCNDLADVIGLKADTLVRVDFTLVPVKVKVSVKVTEL